MRLSLATYNIHACIGADRRFDPGRILQVLRELDADVVALQEVEHRAVGDVDLLDHLAAETGQTAIPGPTLLRDTRDYGNALLTRLPIIRVKRIDLSAPGREPRGAIEGVLAWHGLHLQVVATHLGLKPWERRHQVRQLLALYDSATSDVSVLLGDLNEWLLWGRPLRWLRRRFAPTPHLRTYPARFPLFALDRIWVNPHAALTRILLHDSPMARIASDHLPLRAELTSAPLQTTPAV